MVGYFAIEDDLEKVAGEGGWGDVGGGWNHLTIRTLSGTLVVCGDVVVWLCGGGVVMAWLCGGVVVIMMWLWWCCCVGVVVVVW